MPFLIVLTVVAVIVAIGALQNGHATTVSFLFWQFEAPLALVILAATVAGLMIGGAIGLPAPCAVGATGRRNPG